MPKCRDNLRRRRRLHRREYRRLCAHLKAVVPLDGKSRPYYEAYEIRREGRKTTYKIRPTNQYVLLMRRLAKLCEGGDGEPCRDPAQVVHSNLVPFM